MWIACQALHKVVLTIFLSIELTPMSTPTTTPSYDFRPTYPNNFLGEPNCSLIPYIWLMRVLESVTTPQHIHHLWQAARPSHHPGHQYAPQPLSPQIYSRGENIWGSIPSLMSPSVTSREILEQPRRQGQNSPCLNATTMQAHHVLLCSHRHHCRNLAYISLHIA